jgi:hypothetical protein
MVGADRSGSVTASATAAPGFVQAQLASFSLQAASEQVAASPKRRTWGCGGRTGQGGGHRELSASARRRRAMTTTSRPSRMATAITAHRRPAGSGDLPAEPALMRCGAWDRVAGGSGAVHGRGRWLGVLGRVGKLTGPDDCAPAEPVCVVGSCPEVVGLAVPAARCSGAGGDEQAPSLPAGNPVEMEAAVPERIVQELERDHRRGAAADSVSTSMAAIRNSNETKAGHAGARSPRAGGGEMAKLGSAR